MADSKSYFRARAPGAMRALMDEFDLEAEDAAAIMGNLGHESGGFKSLQEIKPTVTGSRGGYGWGQWTGARRRAFEAWASAKDVELNSDEANLGYLIHELRTTEAKAISAVKRAKTLETKVKAFELAFERAGVKHYDSRNAWARSALKAFEAEAPTDISSAVAGPPKAKEGPAVVAPAELEPQEGWPVTATRPGLNPAEDPDVYWTQISLQRMNYQPGKVDWLWGGMTAEAIAGWLNDVPDTPAFAAPISLADFKRVFSNLRPLLTKYLKIRFTRPISVARATATAADLPGNTAIAQTWWARLWAKVQAGAVAVGAAFWGGVKTLGENETIKPIAEALAAVPDWIWIATGLTVVSLAAGLIWRATNKSEQGVITDYQTGRLK